MRCRPTCGSSRSCWAAAKSTSLVCWTSCSGKWTPSCHAGGQLGVHLQLQELLGGSEEYIARLLDELQRQMDTQLSTSVAREQLLRRQLQELQQELASLRSQSEEELGSL